MSQFGSGNASFTPAASTTTLNNWVLTALTAGIIGKIKEINWGGAGLTSMTYQTRWARVSNTPATPTALAIVPTNPNATALCSCNTYGTVATGTANTNLFQQDWNVLGGGGILALPIGGEWFIAGGALGTAYNQIGCGNVSGTDANLSNYGVIWEE
jgi:hypothetical protein